LISAASIAFIVAAPAALRIGAYRSRRLMLAGTHRALPGLAGGRVDSLRCVREGIDTRAMVVLSAGHLGTDFANGALPALLPFLVERFDLSYTLAATLILASTVSSSVVQPLFGLWSDRRGAVWLLPAGVAVGGVGIALASDAPSYWLVFVLVTVSGLGVAAFHPEGSKFAAYVSGRRRASGMSAFSVGGNLGFALGAIVATPLVVWFGLRGGLLLALPCLAIAALLLAVTPYLRTFVPARSVRAEAAGEDQVGALVLLLAVIAFRSLAWFGLVTFVPLWEVSLGHSKAHGNHLLSLMLLAGGLGTIAAGPAADRLGRRPVLIASLLLSAPLILVFVAVGGVVGALALCAVGVCTIGTFGVTMVMSQEYLPRHIGTASGLSIGLSIGLGGVAVVALGALADSVDLRTALYVCAAAPVAGLALALVLPSSRGGRALEPEVAVP
jgi:FSR family fosmidomycin resistance protein-like MFS transporter